MLYFRTRGCTVRLHNGMMVSYVEEGQVETAKLRPLSDRTGHSSTPKTFDINPYPLQYFDELSLEANECPFEGFDTFLAGSGALKYVESLFASSSHQLSTPSFRVAVPL